MDFGDIAFFVMMLVAWGYQAWRQNLDKKRQRTPAAGDAASSDTLLERATAQLRQLDADTRALTAGLDGALRRRIDRLLDDHRPETQRLTAEIESLDESSGDFTRVPVLLGELRQHVSDLKQNLAAVGTIVRRRQRPELARVHGIAESALDDWHGELSADAERRGVELDGPPIPVIYDLVLGDALANSPLGASIAVLPRTVVSEPWRLFGLGPELGRWLAHQYPSLLRDLWDGAELGTEPDEAEPGSKELERVMMSSWLSRTFADVVGAQLLGPSYLRALIAAEQNPSALARATTVRVSSDGVLNAEPPSHLRVHATARWLELMGEQRAAAAMRDAWDESHRRPSSLRFTSHVGQPLPLPPVLEATRELVDRLYRARLPTFGGRTLADLPGLAGWKRVAGNIAKARSALGRGQTGPRDSRALLAAAIDTSLDGRQEADAIAAALERSLAGLAGAPPARAERPTPVTKTRVHHPRRRRRAPFPASRTEIAEALVLGKMLLAPRSRH